jgi:SAM-dependent methyltransferase
VSRVRFAARILKPLDPRSILDVGCRDGALAALLPAVDYRGADLLAGDHVHYAGDINTLRIDRTFDVVVACDILEHLPNPSETFDRLLPLAERHFLISLPNGYDLKSRLQFAFLGSLGGKYAFVEPAEPDRHQWLMGREEIRRWAEAKAAKHGLKLALVDMPYGSGASRWTLLGRLAAAILPRSLATATVFALFSRDAGERLPGR